MSTVKILLPESWSDIKLPQFTDYMAFASTRMKDCTRTEIMVRTIEIFTELEYHEIMEMPMDKLVELYHHLDNVLSGDKSEVLEPIISLGGVLYGLHPDITNMTASEGIDIENLVEQDNGTIDIWPNIMQLLAVFYRPVTSIRKRRHKIWRLEFGKKALRYKIERYAIHHQNNHQVFAQMDMKAVNALTVFFYQFARDMLLITQTSTLSGYQRSRKRVMKRRWKHIREQIGTLPS